MGSRNRKRNPPWLDPPPGLCDACTAGCGARHEIGALCYHCGEGVFLVSTFWQLWACPKCLGTDIFCPDCRGKGFLATPREDIDMGRLRAEWRQLQRRNSDSGIPVPPSVAALADLAAEL